MNLLFWLAVAVIKLSETVPKLFLLKIHFLYSKSLTVIIMIIIIIIDLNFITISFNCCWFCWLIESINFVQKVDKSTEDFDVGGQVKLAEDFSQIITGCNGTA